MKLPIKKIGSHVSDIKWFNLLIYNKNKSIGHLQTMRLCSLQSTLETIPFDPHSQAGWQLEQHNPPSEVTADLPIIKSKGIFSVLDTSSLSAAFETDDQPVSS